MTLKTFIIGLLISFGTPWLLIIVVPSLTMNDIDPVMFTEAEDGKEGVYHPLRNGRISDGSKVYGANGCYVCHSQLIRLTDAGSDVWRDDWAGLMPSEDNPVDSRRESNVFDYQGETFAHIGLTRTGPDLSNVGFRIDRYAKEAGVSSEAWLYDHLYDPRAGGRYRSVCAPQKHLFKVSTPIGEGDNDALEHLTEDGEEIVPKAEARALASYLLSMKKNDLLPYSLNSRADKKTAAEQ
jgi:cytochrome c oxidase cbb3-type subunit 2